MRWQERGKKEMQGMLLPVIVCVCFIASSLLFLVQMIVKSEEENITDLYNAANQTRTALLKQIEGDWQTLEGLSVSLQSLANIRTDELMEILTDVNDKNAFIRMGYTDASGQGEMVDLAGNIEAISIAEEAFFQRAMEGEKSISTTFEDSNAAGGYVNYFATRVLNSDGETEGVLCAVHATNVLRAIIDMPLLKNSGYSDILNESGDFVIISKPSMAETALSSNQEVITERIREEDSGSFTVKDEKGSKYMVNVLPLIEGQWYQVSTVPVAVLRSSYIETARGIMAIILAACVLFIWLISSQRRMAAENQKTLMKLAYSDSLTGMRNFDGFKKDAEKFLAEQELSACLIWYADFKNFKFINDVLGYEGGDRLLSMVAEYLKMVESPDCMSCRIAADNFTGIVQCREDEGLVRGHKEILDYLKQSGMEDFPFLEIPLGVYRLKESDRGQTVDVLVNYANMAHKTAKEKNGSAFVYYDDDIRKKTLEDSTLEAEAEPAIRNGEFRLYMQPKVDIQNGNRICGAEVLVRWQNSRLGLIPPGRFIPLFEKSDLIIKLDRYMFEQACIWLKSYLDGGGRPVNIAVNVSKVGIFQPGFVEYYVAVKKKYGIPDHMLELEFTENILAVDTELFSDLVIKLRKEGFLCSLDDFGSGYSSLNLLKDLPVDALKLDILFFRKSRDVRRERIVVSNFINMAKQLNITTIAEGVEEEDTVEFLQNADCDVIQGYIFAKPMPKEEFEAMLGGTDHLAMNHNVQGN